MSTPDDVCKPAETDVRREETRVARARRFLFGDDIFISYARHDSDYALALGDELTRHQLSCFLDQWGTPAGDQLPEELLDKLKKSTMFVLVGTRCGAASANVMKEVVEFKKTGRPIVPITFVDAETFRQLRSYEAAENMTGTLERATWYNEIAGIARTFESEARLKFEKQEKTLTPSPQVITRIINAKGFQSRSKRLRRTFWTTFCSLLALLIAAAIVAWVLVDRANQKVARANREQAVAEGARDQANIARADAEGKTLKAQEDLKIAKGDLKQAAADLLVANQKTVEEQAKALTARKEAELQGRIASSQANAASAIERLDSDPEESVRLAATGYKLEHTTQAERVLRRSLLQSHLRAVIKGEGSQN